MCSRQRICGRNLIGMCIKAAQINDIDAGTKSSCDQTCHNSQFIRQSVFPADRDIYQKRFCAFPRQPVSLPDTDWFAAWSAGGK